MEDTPQKTARKLKPRKPATVAAVLVSQLTSLEIAGIDADRFLAFVRDQNVRRAKVGKLVLVELADLLEAVRKVADAGAEQPDDAHPPERVEADQPGSADDFLARLGMRRSA